MSYSNSVRQLNLLRSFKKGDKRVVFKMSYLKKSSGQGHESRRKKFLGFEVVQIPKVFQSLIIHKTSVLQSGTRFFSRY